MAFTINDVKSQLTFGGARNTLFQVQISNPANSIADIKTPFMVEAASLPESTIGTIEVPYFGRKDKHAGDRVFQPWQTTVINDEDFLIRNALEEWSNKINSFGGNLRNFPSSSANHYRSRGIVRQYSKTGVVIREYTFENIWPASISPIDLNWASTDQIETFQVTWDYTYWTVSGGVTGDAGGS